MSRPLRQSYRGFYLRFSDRMDGEANRRIHSLVARLLEQPLPGVTDLLPGYSSLYVEFDAGLVNELRVRQWIQRQETSGGEEESGRVVEIPVHYDGQDLEEFAARCGLTPSEVASRHAAAPYRVYAMGFMPGFPFLGEVPEVLRQPRHEQPRPRVPAHSVAVAGAQTGIYPLPSPGGWQLLGTSQVAVYDPSRKMPFLVRPGDTVQFRNQGRRRGRPAEAPPEPEPLRLHPEEPERPRLLVRESGLLDLIVDRGRELHGRFGLARSGPLDRPSAAVANALLGNDPDAPLLELNLKGPIMEALADTVVAFAGYGLVPKVDGVPVEPFRSFQLARGSLLSFAPDRQGQRVPGCRGYLAIEGGIESASFGGSASSDLRGLIGRPLEPGDRLGSEPTSGSLPGRAYRPYRFAPLWSRLPSGAGTVRLHLLPGPQYTSDAMSALIDRPFELVAADRTALRFEGPRVPGGEVLSEAVPLGAVQVPPGGNPILLLNDRGTLGGYSKPALLDPRDLPLAGQLAPGWRVRFVAD